MGKKKEKSVAWRIIDGIRAKMKEKAKDDKELLVLSKKNKELAIFIEELERVMIKETMEYFTKHPA